LYKWGIFSIGCVSSELDFISSIAQCETQQQPNLALETESIDIGGKSITAPTVPEMLRTKGWMIVSRNTTRDYIDFTASIPIILI